MDTPRTRAEFERNFNLLHRQIEDGKFSVAQGLSNSLEGLARVRFLPNGRIDFLSIDESARSLANTSAHLCEDSFQEQLKEYRGQPDVAAPQDGEEQSPPTPQ